MDRAGGDGGLLDRLGQVALVAPAVVVALVLLARWVRRRRHRRAGARGAWSEVLDLLVLLDRRPAPWHTAVRIAADLAATFPGPQPHPATLLAASADRATFCPPEVREVAPVAQLRALRQVVRRRTPWYRRLGWLVDPRPLWRRTGHRLR
jgi:hypothetical protein